MCCTLSCAQHTPTPRVCENVRGICCACVNPVEVMSMSVAVPSPLPPICTHCSLRTATLPSMWQQTKGIYRWRRSWLAGTLTSTPSTRSECMYVVLVYMCGRRVSCWEGYNGCMEQVCVGCFLSVCCTLPRAQHTPTPRVCENCRSYVYVYLMCVTPPHPPLPRPTT